MEKKRCNSSDKAHIMSSLQGHPLIKLVNKSSSSSSTPPSIQMATYQAAGELRVWSALNEIVRQKNCVCTFVCTRATQPTTHMTSLVEQHSVVDEEMLKKMKKKKLGGPEGWGWALPLHTWSWFPQLFLTTSHRLGKRREGWGMGCW